MSLSDQIARIEARGVELPHAAHLVEIPRVGSVDRAFIELLAALDEATAALDEANSKYKTAVDESQGERDRAVKAEAKVESLKCCGNCENLATERDECDWDGLHEPL